MLTDNIRLSGPESTDPEDILSSSLAVIFPDDITNQHGDSSSSVIYLSHTFGSITLSLANPDGEDSKRLFSHFLWNAGLQLAEFIEGGQEEGGRDWVVDGMQVLELGAGTGLAGIVACLKGARRTIISDYPAPEVVENISANVRANCKGKDVDVVEVQGHEWGILTDDFSRGNMGMFDRVLVADCLWMPWQHFNLAKSIGWFLKEGGKAWVVAGFHTGREKMRGFFDKEVLRGEELVVEKIWERNAEGMERDWVENRGIENVTERKRWLVCAVLRKVGEGGI